MEQKLTNYQKNQEQILVDKKEKTKLSRKEKNQWDRDLWTRV
ncbi:hypothetical protein [Spiroplasma endosymbiont of Zeiraphera isertana]